MTMKKVNARPKNLAPSVLSWIAKRAIENNTVSREYLALTIIKEIIAMGEIPPTEETCIAYISRARAKYTLDKPWTSASLYKERISPAAIPCLIGLQIYRKLCLSKPMTIREARWFDNLFNLRDEAFYRGESRLPPEYKNIFHSHVIATCAQIYAYREKIDIIAGIEDADYSNLDIAIMTGELISLRVNVDNNAKEKEWAWGFKHQNEWLISHLDSVISSVEASLVDHSVGTPEMADDSIYFYAKTLSFALNPVLRARAIKLPYILKIRLLVLLREWAKQHPDASDETITPVVEESFNRVENEGMGWEDRNWKILKIPS